MFLPWHLFLPDPLHGGSVLWTPSLASAPSVTGWTIEVIFTGPVDPDSEGLLDIVTYTLTEGLGGAASTVLAVNVGQQGEEGVSSVILTHSGTTLGGFYTVTATAMGSSSTTLLAMGEPPAFTGTISGTDVILTFDHPLTHTDALGDLPTYSVEATTDYPIPMTLLGVVYPFDSDPTKIKLSTKGMTTLDYAWSVGSDAVAFWYDGTYLPDAGSTFTGIAFGSGQSVISPNGLSMSSNAGAQYGWLFADNVSGKVAPDTTYRMDISLDVGSSFSPAISLVDDGVFLAIVLEDSAVGDGGIQVELLLQKTDGVDQIRVLSGDFDSTYAVQWTVGTGVLSIVRNLLAGIYTILADGQPFMSAAIADFTQPTTGSVPGLSFAIVGNPDVSVSGLLVHSVKFTASQTIYSTAWNFLHDWQALFQGGNTHTRDFILTDKGPLVKSWGDMTPATKNDVEVKVNGVSVPVLEVNPYLGKITLVTPIPLLPYGDPHLADVKVTYQWLATPVMELAGLNTDGAVLNKWDRNINGFHDNGAIDWAGWDTRDLTTIPYDRRGAPDISRFPMGVVLGPMDTPEPLMIGHRYMGFIKETSALLNSATTLLLNQDPTKYELPGFAQIPVGVVAAFEGTSLPEVATPAWTLTGTNAATTPVQVDGTFVVKDDQSGSYRRFDPPCVMYQQGVDLSFPAMMYVVTRYELETWTPDGVFTGVGFGFHDDERLYLVGNLLVNAVQHVGMLTDARNPHLLASWQIGPQIEAKVLTSTTISFPTPTTNSKFPSSFRVNDRFQILSPHTQTGVYTATQVVRHTDNTTTVTVTPAFPADPNKYGNKYPTVIFETLWAGKPSTYRLTMAPDKDNQGQKIIQLIMSGLTSSFVTEFTGPAAELPMPAETSLALFTNQHIYDAVFNPSHKAGEVFWGSLSYKAKSQSTWSFTRYGVQPNVTAIRGHAKLALTDMSVLPENEPDQAWYLSEAFGYSKVVGGVLYLKATSGSNHPDSEDDVHFSYSRNEPFFVKDSILDLTAKFRVDSANTKTSGASISLADGVRGVGVATLMYYENSMTYSTYRRTVSMPSVSLTGLIRPEDQDWHPAENGEGFAVTHENDLVFDQISGNANRYKYQLRMWELDPPDSGDRVFEARFAVDAAYVADSITGDTGIFIAVDSGSGATTGIAVTPHMNGVTPTVRLVTADTFALVHEFNFDWTDGQLHTYRVVASGGTVSLFLDEVAQPVQAVGGFLTHGSGQHRCLFGNRSTGGVGQVRWRSLSYQVLPHSSVKRTLGVKKESTLHGDDIDAWELPRTDSSTALNSAEIGPVIQEMDWRVQMEVRIFRSPTWGVTVFRPDLPPPPYYVPETISVPGSGYTNENVEPSAGWINVEYAKLPYNPISMGFIGFGSIDPRNVAQQRWDEVRFKLSKTPTDDWKAPQHMVLNQASVVTSGDALNDVTLENLVIEPIQDINGLLRCVTLLPTHIYATDVYKVVDGDTIYTRESWSFNPTTQLLTLNQNPDGTFVLFSGASVNVVFYPSKDVVTNTYLLTQPLLDSMTLLNEGTPPMPKSQIMADQTVVNSGVRSFVRGTETLTHLSATGVEDDVTGPEALYEAMTFMTVDNGAWVDLITIIGEGVLPPGFTGYTDLEGEAIYDNTGTPTGDLVGKAVGGHVLALEGPKYTEQHLNGVQDLLVNFQMVHGGAELSLFDKSLGLNLFVSGGNFLSPVVDGGGKQINTKPAGGVLNSGLVLYPIKAVQ